MNYLLDTNPISDWLKSFQPIRNPNSVSQREMEARQRLRTRIEALPVLRISVLTRWEIERGLKIRQAIRRLENFQTFCDQVDVLPLDENIWEVAVNVWVTGQRHGCSVSDADVLIAATALVHDLTLVTRDQNLMRCCRHHEPLIFCEDWSLPGERRSGIDNR